MLLTEINRQTFIGLGTVGSNIINLLSERYSEYYNLFKIEVNHNCPIYSSHQEYELNPVPEEVVRYLSSEQVKSSSIFFILCGTEDITGASLKLLELLKNSLCKITVVYVKADSRFTPQTKKTQEEFVYKVLQEYARSDQFELMLLFDNKHLINKLPGCNLHNYKNIINEYIIHQIHTINLLNINITNMLFSTFDKLKPISKIASVSVGELTNNGGLLEVTSFNDLKLIKESRLYYLLSKQDSENNDRLTQILESTQQSGVTCAVFQSEHDKSYLYKINYSSMIQDY